MDLIQLSSHEVQSGTDRVKAAEMLISNLPKDHDGRNTWLLNFGTSEEAINMRADRNINFDPITNAAYHTNQKIDAVQIKIITPEIEEELDLLYALQGAGVDNWEGYDFALESLEKGGEEEDKQ